MKDEHCESCRPGMPLIKKDEIIKMLREVPDWRYDESKNVIERSFDFKNFYQTMAFVNAVAWIANQEGHHPDMQVGYNKTIISYNTHEAGGITKNDFICAAKINALR